MIRHIVMWKLIAEDPAGQKVATDAMAAALEPLVGQIEGLEAAERSASTDADDVESSEAGESSEQVESSL